MDRVVGVYRGRSDACETGRRAQLAVGRSCRLPLTRRGHIYERRTVASGIQRGWHCLAVARPTRAGWDPRLRVEAPLTEPYPRYYNRCIDPRRGYFCSTEGCFPVWCMLGSSITLN